MVCGYLTLQYAMRNAMETMFDAVLGLSGSFSYQVYVPSGRLY